MNVLLMRLCKYHGSRPLFKTRALSFRKTRHDDEALLCNLGFISNIFYYLPTKVSRKSNIITSSRIGGYKNLSFKRFSGLFCSRMIAKQTFLWTKVWVILGWFAFT
uniref:G-protein coupled receptors family 1 profile domain-containing protein n=1 Tax=Parascaris univalens TaxID=6257 RepID=A0A915AYB0_PARUN